MVIAKPIFKKLNWGNHGTLLECSDFRLEKIRVAEGASADLGGHANFETTLWIEQGSGLVQGINMGGREIITLPPRQKWNIAAEKSITAYLFSGPAAAGSEYLVKAKPFNYRERYWGSIQSIADKDYCGKIISIGRGKNTSLEFHCKKIEGYYIYSGTLLLHLRDAQAQDQFSELKEGSTVLLPAGLMHQKGGLEDTVIIEISTRDQDTDSFLVENGKEHPMPELKKYNN